MLVVKDIDNTYVVHHSYRNEKIHLEDVLEFSPTSEHFSFSKARMECFAYLNEHGYEMVSSNLVASD